MIMIYINWKITEENVEPNFLKIQKQLRREKRAFIKVNPRKVKEFKVNIFLLKKMYKYGWA
jgi:hypothetical protein